MKIFIDRLKSLNYPIKNLPENHINFNEKYPYFLPVIPLKNVSLKEQLKLAKIILRVKFEKFLKEDSSYPYWIAFRLGEKDTALSQLKLLKNESGLNLAEGIALAIHYPQILDNRSVDLISSKYGEECVPTIYKWDGKINLSAICGDVRDEMCGPAIKKKIGKK